MSVPLPARSDAAVGRSPASNEPAPRWEFRWRLISSLVLWGIMLAVVFGTDRPIWLYLFMNIVLGRALWEFYLICETKGLKCFKIWGVAAALALISGSWFFFSSREFKQLSYDFDIFILVVFALGVFLRQFPQKHNPAAIETMAVTLFGLLYVGWLGNFITRINFAFGHGGDGRMFVLFLVVVTKFTDIGAYLVGSSIGRHKMIPRISPKKTWEGAAGGLAFALGGAWLCRLWGMPATMDAQGLNGFHTTALALLLGAAAVIGDLAESLVKREAGVKDSSRWLPGQGGALDLVDSLLFTAPLLYVYLRLMPR